MFLVTLVIVFTYATLLFTLLQNGEYLRHPIGVDLPAFTASLNYLLLFSHGGYLTDKYS